LLWLFGCCSDAYSIRAIDIMDMSLKKVYIKPIL